MAIFSIAGCEYQIACIVFDKDGTLVDLHLLWGSMMERWVRLAGEQLGVDVSAEIYQTVGYDPRKKRVIPDSILAVSTLPQLAIATAVVFHQHGIDWHHAQHVVEQIIIDPLHGLPTREMLRPLYQPATLQKLHDVGIKLAILTSDDRAPTEAALHLLGIDQLFCAVGCADDPIPPKPDAAGIVRIAALCGVNSAEMLMVGDSRGDMVTGRNAGVAACIGIGSAERLAPIADHIFVNIDALLTHLP